MIQEDPSVYLKKKGTKSWEFREEEFLSEPGFSLRTRPPKSLELSLGFGFSLLPLRFGHCRAGAVNDGAECRNRVVWLGLS